MIFSAWYSAVNCARDEAAVSRRMNGAKGGKVSVASPPHFPIEKARLIRDRKAAQRQRRKQFEEEKALNPFALPPGKRNGY
jgi:hypothetical protein